MYDPQKKDESLIKWNLFCQKGHFYSILTLTFATIIHSQVAQHSKQYNLLPSKGLRGFVLENKKYQIFLTMLSHLIGITHQGLLFNNYKKISVSDEGDNNRKYSVWVVV